MCADVDTIHENEMVEIPIEWIRDAFCAAAAATDDDGKQ